MNKFPNTLSHGSQKGAVLIVALVMLLLLTIIGISSMRGTTMQERMAGNMRDQSQAFQASESALRKGEAAIRGMTVATLQNLTVAPDWTNSDTIDGLSAAPKYKMTPIPGVSLIKAGESLKSGTPIDMAVMRVEAQGYGATTNVDNSAGSTVNLRSIYIKR